MEKVTVIVDGKVSAIDTDYDGIVTIITLEMAEEKEPAKPKLKSYEEVMALLLEDGFVYSVKDRRFNGKYGYVLEDILNYCGKEIPSEYIDRVPAKYQEGYEKVDEELDEPTYIEEADSYLFN